MAQIWGEHNIVSSSLFFVERNFQANRFDTPLPLWNLAAYIFCIKNSWNLLTIWSRSLKSFCQKNFKVNILIPPLPSGEKTADKNRYKNSWNLVLIFLGFHESFVQKNLIDNRLYWLDTAGLTAYNIIKYD